MSEINCMIKSCNKKAKHYVIITKKTVAKLVTDKGYVMLYDTIEEIPINLCDEHFKLLSSDICLLKK